MSASKPVPEMVASPEDALAASHDLLLPDELREALSGARERTGKRRWSARIGDDGKPGVVTVYLGETLKATKASVESAVTYLNRRGVKAASEPRP